MTTLDQGLAAHSPLAGGWFARLRDEFRRARLERQTFDALSRLNDRELDDLGLRRGELRAAAHKAVLGY